MIREITLSNITLLRGGSKCKWNLCDIPGPGNESVLYIVKGKKFRSYITIKLHQAAKNFNARHGTQLKVKSVDKGVLVYDSNKGN